MPRESLAADDDGQQAVPPAASGPYATPSLDQMPVLNCMVTGACESDTSEQLRWTRQLDVHKQARGKHPAIPASRRRARQHAAGHHTNQRSSRNRCACEAVCLCIPISNLQRRCREHQQRQRARSAGTRRGESAGAWHGHRYGHQTRELPMSDWRPVERSVIRVITCVQVVGPKRRLCGCRATRCSRYQPADAQASPAHPSSESRTARPTFPKAELCSFAVEA